MEDEERYQYSLDVVETTAHQVGDKYDYYVSGYTIAVFDDYDKALKAFDEYKFLDDPQIVPTIRGLDTVEFLELRLYVDVVDESDEVWDAHYEERKDNLPAEWYEAMRTHEHEYHEFLDHKRDHYRSLRDIIGTTDDGRG